MSAKYSLTFAVLSASCLAAWLALQNGAGWVAVPLLGPALSFALLSAAYAGAGARLLFKLSSGSRSPGAWLLHWPYFLLNTVTFSLYRKLSDEPAFVRVSGNLYFGRWLSAHEASSVNWEYVLDLAAEFAEVRPLRQLPGYRSLPILDATAPTEDQLRTAVDWVSRSVEAGPVYVHCALGHGRSACVVIAYLLSAGQVGTVPEGIQLLKSLRPGVGLDPAQRRRLQDFEPKSEGSAGLSP